MINGFTPEQGLILKIADFSGGGTGIEGQDKEDARSRSFSG